MLNSWREWEYQQNCNKTPWHKTINGYLRKLHSNIKQRCTNPKVRTYRNYGGRGIECKFESASEFVYYVVCVLKIDPRGLQIDRIDNDGHYEKGNIQFMTKTEHDLKHRTIRYKDYNRHSYHTKVTK